MQLTETVLTNQTQLEELVATLNWLRLEGKLKIVSGSFNLNAIVDCEFVEQPSGDRWRLYCVNDNHGKGSLRRVP